VAVSLYRHLDHLNSDHTQVHNFDPVSFFSSKSKTCLTPACIHASSEYLYNLSPQYKELDPCTDFEELVCGGWKDRHDLRPDQGDAFTGTIMSENSQTLLRHVLEEPYPKESRHSYFSPMQLGSSKKSADEENYDKMKAAYTACLSEDTIKHAGIWPLMDIIHQITDLFPISPTGATTADTDAFRKTIGFLSELGISALIASGTGADDRDPDTVVVQVGPPYRIGLPAKERYEDEKIVAKYKTVVTDVLSALLPETVSNLTYAGVVEFERQLAAASPNGEDWGNVTKYYNPMSLEEATALAPQLDIAGILTGLAPPNVLFERLIVTFPQYLRDLSALLTATPDEILQCYFVWKAVQSLAYYVDADAVKPYKQFSNMLQGKVRGPIYVSHLPC
jgi:endothelin-converting enzyme